MSKPLLVAAAVTAPAAVPVLWHPLGYEVEAGSLIAGICACLAVRLYAATADGPHKWKVDFPVSVIALGFTIGIILQRRPDPFWAMVYGTGLGALGAGIITMAMAWVKKTSSVFMPPAEPSNPALGRSYPVPDGEAPDTGKLLNQMPPDEAFR